MKIRTDFVTNSSSSCMAEVRIDNPVLMKLLREYWETYHLEKRLGGRLGTKDESGKEWVLNFEDWSAEEYVWEYTGPTCLTDVLTDLLGAMERDDGFDPSEEIREFKELILAHKKEIDDGYISVDWVIGKQRYGEFMSYEDIEDALGDDFDPQAYYEFTTSTSNFSYTPETGEDHYTDFEVD